MQKQKKELYELISNKGEGVFGNFNIIHLEENKWCFYHSDGYRIDSWLTEEDEEIYYHFASDLFEGFRFADIRTALQLVEKEL